ncbi:MAG: transcription termination/antitermination NusG family protein [Planctomycetota bacterium]
MLKESENPACVWPQDKSLSEFCGIWWVAHTKSRNEKALAHDLGRKNVGYFLPMDWKVSRQRGRTIRSLLPLFNGYVFFCGNEDDRLTVLRTSRVANLLIVKDQMKLVTELSQIEQVLRAGIRFRPHNYLRAGLRCRVIAGPLMGVEGIIAEVTEHTKLVLQVDMLGQATSVEIDQDMIELIE